MTHEEEENLKPGEFHLEVNQDIKSGCRYTLTVKGSSTAFTYHEDKVKDFIITLRKENKILLSDLTGIRQAFTQALRPHIQYCNETKLFGSFLQVGPLRIERRSENGVGDNPTRQLQFDLYMDTGRLNWTVHAYHTVVINSTGEIDYDAEEDDLYALIRHLFDEVAEKRKWLKNCLSFLQDIWVQERIAENVVIGGPGDLGDRMLSPQEIRATLSRIVSTFEAAHLQKKEN